MQVTREQAKLIYRQQNPNYQKTHAEAIRINRSSVKETEIREGMVKGRGGVGEVREVIVGVSGGMTQQSKEEIKQKISSPEIICFSPGSCRELHKNY